MVTMQRKASKFFLHVYCVLHCLKAVCMEPNPIMQHSTIVQFTLNDTLLAVPGSPLNGITCIPGKGVSAVVNTQCL